MAKYPGYFSSDDTTDRAQSLAPQTIWLDQLEIKYRELQKLRERVREAEEQSADRPMIANNE